jgi:Uma2 family endonuclease
MYERFTDRARKVMLLAEMEARRFHHEYIGTEHILLGLIQEGSGVGANVLRHFGITFLRVRQEVEKIIHSGPPVVVRGKRPLTPRARRVIEYATEEADELNHKHVGTEHLLLGLLREEEGVAAQVLMNLGLTDLVRVRLVTLAMVRLEKVKVPQAPLPAQGPECERPNEGIAMFEGFTDRARKVMKLADKEARRFNHEYIGTEHILLGLVKEGSGVAANVLKNLDIDLRKTRREVEKNIQPGPRLVTMWKLPLTPMARKVIEHATEEAGKLGHKPPGTEHLLLGLLREQEGVAAQVLRNLGLDLDKVRRMTLAVLGCGTATVQRTALTAPVAPPDRSPDHLRTLERQLWNLRVLLGAVVGALAGGVLAAETGAVVGLLVGGVVAGLGRFLPAALAGGITGILLGSAHLASEGGGVTGALVGALAGVLLVEVGRPAGRWTTLRRRCRPPGAVPRAAVLRKDGYPMAGVIAQPSPSLGAAPATAPGPRLWTREEFYRLANLGFFWNQRVELIEGEIMVLGPQSAEHCTSAYHVSLLLRHHFRAGFHVRIQGPLELGASAPDPDVALICGAWEQYARQHPTSAALIVEVSDSSLDYDRGRKASLYARAGVAEYWIVNLVERRLEVRRGPRPDASQPFGHGYADVTTLTPPAVVSPLADSQVSLAVANLLP